MKSIKTVSAVLALSVMLAGCGQGWDNFYRCGDVNKSYNPTNYTCNYGDATEHADDFDAIQVSSISTTEIR